MMCICAVTVPYKWSGVCVWLMCSDIQHALVQWPVFAVLYINVFAVCLYEWWYRLGGVDGVV